MPSSKTAGARSQDVLQNSQRASSNTALKRSRVFDTKCAAKACHDEGLEVSTLKSAVFSGSVKFGAAA